MSDVKLSAARRCRRRAAQRRLNRIHEGRVVWTSHDDTCTHCGGAGTWVNPETTVVEACFPCVGKGYVTTREPAGS